MEKNNSNKPNFRKARQVNPHFGQERQDRMNKRLSLNPAMKRKLVISSGCLITKDEYLENLKSGENQ